MPHEPFQSLAEPSSVWMAFYEEVSLPYGDNYLSLRVRELPLADGVHGSTGNQHWPSGTVLARELLEQTQLVKGRSVLDLGAGCGLAGMVAAAIGAKRVVLTDGDEETLQNLKHNVEASSSLYSESGSLQVKHLRWQDAEAWPDEEKVDLVISSDTVFGHFGGALASCALRVLKADSQVILVAPEDRRAGVPEFLARMHEAGYQEVKARRTEEEGEAFWIYELQKERGQDVSDQSYQVECPAETVDLQ